MDDFNEPTQKMFDRLLDEDEAFYDFVNDEFNNAAGQSSVEALAIYAFGSLEETLEAYAEFRRRNP